MENKHTSITFKAKVKPIKPVNEEFTLCKAYVMGLGVNRNFSYISREATDAALPTLGYCPVVGHLIRKEDGTYYMGSHDYTITEDWELKSITVPYGVVVEDSFDYEDVEEFGETVTYLTANIILWTGRYEDLNSAIYSDDFYFNQSMEINPKQWRNYKEDSNYTDIVDYSFSALCLLGKADSESTNGHTDENEHSEPCFISASVIPIEFSKSEFAEAMNEMKEKLSFCLKNQSSTTVTDVTMEVDIDKNNGGSTMAEEIKNEVVDEVTETVVEETLEETVENTVEDVAEEVVEETTDETAEEIVEETVEENKEEASTEEVVEETTEETVAEESNEDYSVLYSELKEKYDALENEVVSLREYKQAKESEERKCAEDALFADYEETIGETEEFKSLKEKASEFSLDALKKECLCIVGMYSMTNKTKETNKSDSLKFSLEPEVSEDEPYGGLMKKYLGK